MSKGDLFICFAIRLKEAFKIFLYFTPVLLFFDPSFYTSWLGFKKLVKGNEGVIVFSGQGPIG